MVLTSRSGTVALNPTWWRAAAGFVGLGIEHILTGYDHLLFLLCLVIPLRGWRQVLSVITISRVAHSFTLLGSAFHLAPRAAGSRPSSRRRSPHRSSTWRSRTSWASTSSGAC